MLQQLKIELPASALEVDECSLGVYVKLLNLAETMTIKGVFVNGHVLSQEEMAEMMGLEESWSDSFRVLGEAGLLRCFDGVWYIDAPQKVFFGTVYREDVLYRVCRSVKDGNPKANPQKVAIFLQECGTFPKTLDEDEILERIRFLYASFGEDRSKMIGYMAMFRTKKQIEAGMRMHVPKHLNILMELHGIYHNGSFDRKGQVYKVDRMVLMTAVEDCVRRQLSALANHNYLKVVLVNKLQSPTPSRKENYGPRRASEGY